MVMAAKTSSAIVVHMAVAFVTMYLFTGSLAFGGVAAIVEPVCNALVMPLHEKLWDRIRRRLAKRAERQRHVAQAGRVQAA